MKIWVDADACPGVIKDILFRAAQRTGTALVLVANHPLTVPPTPNIRAIQVSGGFDVADDEIVQHLIAGDLVITADLPLAYEVLERGALALNPRGELYDKSTIRAKVNMRDFMETMRASGEHTGGPKPLSQADRQAFGNQLDTLLTRARRKARTRS